MEMAGNISIAQNFSSCLCNRIYQTGFASERQRSGRLRKNEDWGLSGSGDSSSPKLT